MQAHPSVVALVLAFTAGCGAPSQVSGGTGGGVSSSSSSAGGGGGAPLDCAALAVTAPADVGMPGGLSARPALVFGTGNGRVVSIFHAWSTAASAGPALQVTTLEPWESWPPVAGDHFAVDPEGGQTFAVAASTLGNVGLLLRHLVPGPNGGDGLNFAGGVSATSPQTLTPDPVAPVGEDPAAVMLVKGEDTPPVAFNVGYMAMLAMWDTIDATSGAHALRLGVTTGDTPLFGLLEQQPGDPDLACAGDRIAAAAVRYNSSWLVLTASGSDLMQCGDAISPDPPSSLAVDRLDWETPEVTAWTTERSDEAQGTVPIERIRMIPTLDGGLALVQRGGHADLVHVDPGGTMHPAGTLAPVDGARILLSEIVALSKGSLLAHVDQGAPGRVHLELRDRDGVARGSAAVEASGPIESLSVLAARAGDAVLLGWATSGGALQLARVGCKGGT